MIAGIQIGPLGLRAFKAEQASCGIFAILTKSSNECPQDRVTALNRVWPGGCFTLVHRGVYGMGIIAWLVLGLIAGFIASKIYAGTGQGVLLDIMLGIVGAFVGGFLFSTFGGTGVTGFNIYSMIVAIIGAIVVLWIYHTVVGRRAL